VAAGTGYTVGSPNSASGTIADDDFAPVVSVSATDASGAEAGADAIVFVITRSVALSTAITVNLSWTGSATMTADYTVSATGGTLGANNATITLAAGATTATLSLTPVNDTAIEGVETVSLTLAAGTGYAVGSPNSASGTITDDDFAAVVSVSATDANGAEAGSDAIVFVITRTVILSTAITVNLSWTGSATMTTDYTVGAMGGTLGANNATITLAAGVASATLTLTPVNDNIVEGAETINLTLAAGTGYVLGSPSAASGTIADDDSASLSITDASTAEGNGGTKTVNLTVSLSNPSSTTVTVAWATGGGTATSGVDYQAASGTVTFTAGQTTQTIVLTVIGDRTTEPNETFQVQLSSPVGATISDGIGVVTIVDDEKALTAATAAPESADTVALTVEDVMPLLNAGIEMWKGAGATTPSADEITILVADLPDTILAIADGSTITIDSTAAGYGWLVDSRNSDANHFDLLTMLTHELGHILGYEHTDGGVMNDQLRPGTRDLHITERSLTFVDLPLDGDSEWNEIKKKAKSLRSLR
jgi:hypothetical protein